MGIGRRYQRAAVADEPAVLVIRQMVDVRHAPDGDGRRRRALGLRSLRAGEPNDEDEARGKPAQNLVDNHDNPRPPRANARPPPSMQAEAAGKSKAAGSRTCTAGTMGRRSHFL